MNPILTLDDLSALIARAAWFTRVGEFPGREDASPLRAVASSDDWDWLPTSRDQPDPIHGRSLVDLAERMGRGTARREAEMTAVREALASLRPVRQRHPGLVDGPHDYTPAAKGGAQYAVRMAAREIVAERPSLWCSIIQEFERGLWPCGLSTDKRRLVIY